MERFIKEAVWNQFGACIDALENAIKMCPAELWNNEKKFWYNAYHCLFWLDYYLTPETENFAPPAPFTLSECDPADAMPDRIYTKAELFSYLNFCREKCRAAISGLTFETARSDYQNISKTITFSRLEILLYNMRHVAHHVAQLGFILRQEINDAPRWVARAGTKLSSE